MYFKRWLIFAFENDSLTITPQGKVVPLSDEGITDIDTYRSCLRTLHGQAVVEAKTKQSPWSFSTRYLTTWKSAASVSPYHTCPAAFWSLSALEQLAYKARITSGISDVCPAYEVAPHSVDHLSNCQSHPMQHNLAAVTDFLNLDNWW